MKLYRKDIKCYIVDHTQPEQKLLAKLAFRNPYDLISNDIATQVFNLVKQQKELTIEINVSPVVHKILKQEILISLTVHVKPKDSVHLTNKDFLVSAQYYQPSNLSVAVIQMSILLSNEFSEKNYSQIYYYIYEAIRHEIEHHHKYSNTDEKEYHSLLNTLKIPQENKDMEKWSEEVKNYITHQLEVESFARSIVYVAKKQKVPYFRVTKSVLFKTFFNEDQKLMDECMENPIIRKNVYESEKAINEKIEEMFPRISLGTYPITPFSKLLP